MLFINTQLLVPIALASTVLGLPWRLFERAVIVDDPYNLDESYDYVIIGGGTSGLTVADRLSEDPKSMLVVGTDYVCDC